ncbi:MAG: hypothetical protein Q7R31_03170 [Candidatus Levybacteria bacterium]|nr:hypothetical protein [Candidatus Levybacteria bacterium]
MIFVLNARAVFLTGHDVSGQWNPLSFAPIPDEPAQAEIPYTLMAPILGILPSSLFSAHIFHAIINSFLVVILFFIVLRLLGKGPAFLVGLVACFSPWNIFFGRSAFEASLAVFFYTFGFFILLKTTRWKILWTFIPLALGFYTYMAYKILLLPYLFIISLYTWSQIHNRKYTKQYVVLFLACIALLAGFLFALKYQNTANRLGELSFVSSAAINKQVNTERQLAIQNPFKEIVSNKAVAILKDSIAKYYGAFSLQNLFIDNEKTLRFHIYNHGYFYYADLLFFILGFCYLFAYKRKLWLFLILILLLAPLPSIISSVETSYAMRASLYIPFFHIIIGTGIWYSLMLLKKGNILIPGTIIIAGIYTIFVGNFLYTYFFIQPIYASEGTAFSARVVARYVALANEEKKPITVVVEAPKILYKDFIFYSNSYNRETASHFRNDFLRHTYAFEFASFRTCTDTKTLDKNTTYIFDPGAGNCQLFKDSNQLLTIAQLSDSGTIYSIYQDVLCSPYELKPYISHLTVQDFSVEKLTKKQFCETFIIDYQRK